MTHDGDRHFVATPTTTPPTLPRRAFRVLRRLGPVGPLAVAASALPAVGGLALYGRLGVIAPWLRDHPSVGPVLCAAAFALAGGAALVPTYAMSALCGWSFGFAPGLTATMSGFVAAALVGYAVGRIADGGRTLSVIGGVPKWKAVRAALATDGFWKVVLVVGLVRLAPAAPFSLTNLVMAAAQVRFLPYAVGTLCGMTPRTAVLVFAASRLSSADAPLADEPWMVALGGIATVAVLLAIGWLGRKGLAQVTPASETP